MNKKILAVIWMGFFIRAFTALWNVMMGPGFWVGGDAFLFHENAVAYSNNLTLDEFIVGHFYSYFLGFIYFITGDSFFVGGILSAITWLISAYILKKINTACLMSTKHQYLVMLIYSLLPSSIAYTSLTMREAYQMLFLNLAIFSTLKIYLSKSNRYWITLFFAVVGMGVLHGALMAFGLFIIIITIFLASIKNFKKFISFKIFVAIPLVSFIILYGISIFTNFSYNLDNGLAAAIERNQLGSLATDARANYKDNVEINSSVSLLFFLPISLFQYLFEPMPWRISSMLDLVSLTENILRAWLIWKIFIGLKKMSSVQFKPVLFIVISYFLIELIWSVGTINWGTSIRHHLPSIGLLLVAALAYSPRKEN
jgi:hypothetical protein